MDRSENAMRALRWLVGSALLLALSHTHAVATAQMGDQLTLRSGKYWIETNPLEPYFEAHPGLRPESDVNSTGLWRGYVASWEILGDELVLTDVSVLRWKHPSDVPDTELYSVMSNVFPGQQKVVARWFTGYLICPSGKLVDYVHMGYASTYERYKILTVVGGRLELERPMTEKQFRSFRKAQFRAWQKTEEYAKEFADVQDEGDDPSETESFLFKYHGARFMSIIFKKLRK